MKEREMKDSGIPWIGEIPIEWKIIPHKHIMHKEKEIKDTYEGEPILSLTKKGVIIRDLNAGGKMPTSFDGYQIVKIGDILQCLFDIDVTPCCVGLVKNFGLVSPAYSRFIADNNCHAPYYCHLLAFMDDKKVLLHLSKNLRNSLTETDFGAVYTCLPPLSEQKAIAEFLDRKCGEIDELVTIQNKMIEELKAYKQSIITETVTKGLNPNVPLKDSGIEWIGEIPQHWENIRLKEGFRLRTGTTPKDFEKGLDSDSLINWFTPSDIAEMNCELNKSERHLSRNVINKEGILLNPIGTLIFVGIGASAGKIGYSLIESYSNQQITNLIPNEDKIVGKYIYYYLLADRKRIRDNAFFTTLPIINNSYLSSIKILTPPLSEQQEIADYLDNKCSEIDSLIELKQQKIEEFKDYKKSIIYEYVTGKKSVEI